MIAAIALLSFARGVRLHPPKPVFGIWEGHAINEGQLNPEFDKLIICRLTLKKDGTFRWRFSDHVMVNIEQTGTGRYTVQGNRVHVLGQQTGYEDDGSQHHYKTEPFGLDLTVADGQLLGKPDAWPPFIFARQGMKAHVPSSIGPIPVVRNPIAENILKLVADTYHHLKSYSDSGEVVIKKTNYLLQAARFETYFIAPANLRFKTELVDSGKVSAEGEVWTDGRKTVHYSSLDDFPGVQTDGANSLGFFSLGQGFGIEADLTPPLLLGEPLPLGLSRQILLQGTDVVGGQKCWIVRVRRDKDSSTSYWIDCNSHLILVIRDHNIAGDEEVRYRPKENPPVTAAELGPTQPRSFHP